MENFTLDSFLADLVNLSLLSLGQSASISRYRLSFEILFTPSADSPKSLNIWHAEAMSGAEIPSLPPLRTTFKDPNSQ